MNYQKALKELREKLIISQQELADLLGVSYNSVNRWENGAYAPTIKVKRKLAQLFKENDIKLEEYDDDRE